MDAENIHASGAGMKKERTLLLVDDEGEVGTALARLLRPYGYKILQAMSGREGLTMLAQNEAGVVVADQRMPEMTGVEFLAQVRKLYPNTVRIVLSGYTELNSVTDAINRGAIYKFLVKPWDNEALCADILEAFRHYELIQEKERLLREIQSANSLLLQVNLEWANTVVQRDGHIKRISSYDPLTDLPNRLLFLDRLTQKLSNAQLNGNQTIAVMFINLDCFRQINGSFGHLIGNQLLQAVAGRLRKYAGAGDTVANMGGDEFGFILAGMEGAKNAGGIAQEIIDTFARDPMSVGGREVFITARIGISLYPFDGIETNALAKNAGIALHHAKAAGGNCLHFYAAQMDATAWQHMTMETVLRQASECEEFELYYQPKVNLANGKITGMEALLRWQSAARGLLTPGGFIPFLEETGRILQVDTWVLDTACQQAKAWQEAGLCARIAVNLSALQFRQPGFLATVRNILEKNSPILGVGMLELELTESLLLKDVNETASLLNELRRMGVRLSIDDFGGGYLCLNHLKHLPIDSLKIDQSFISNLSANGDDAAIVNAIITLGHGLGMSVIAEGVETVEQLVCLQSMGCDEVQGYLFSRPVPAAEMTLLLQNEMRQGSTQAEP